MLPSKLVPLPCHNMGSSDPHSMAAAPKRPFSVPPKAHRRADPSVSVSLRHRKRVRLEHGSSVPKDQISCKDPLESASNPSHLVPQESSSDQSATKWFDGVNENVVKTGRKTSAIEGCYIHCSISDKNLTPRRGGTFLSHSREIFALAH